jgi:hypothetical protein
MHRLVQYALSAWLAWRVRRACPELARVRAEIAAARRRHKRVRHLERRQREIVNGLLMRVRP